MGDPLTEHPPQDLLALLGAGFPIRGAVSHDFIPNLIGYDAANRPVGLWGDVVRGNTFMVDVPRAVLSAPEREALGIVAAVLGAPA